ncbi:MAG: RNase adapter RapZ [Pseudomonadota bacterium]
MTEGGMSDGDRRHAGIVIVAGLSGAGRSTAINAFEDLGYEAVDNLPLSLIETLVLDGPPAGRPIALGIASATRGFSPSALRDVMVALRARLALGRVLLLFLDCDDTVLSRRFSETRRRHPLAPAEDVETGILRERGLIEDLRDFADILIDTTTLSPHDLKHEIGRRFGPAAGVEGSVAPGLAVTVNSFSYRRGVPPGCDVVMDVRFLRNPYWVEDLRDRDGRDVAVQAHVIDDPRYEGFFEGLVALLLLLLPAYVDEGKVYFSVALGCTGGRHRSVCVAERLSQRLHAAGWPAAVRHRELERMKPPAVTTSVGDKGAMSG